MGLGGSVGGIGFAWKHLGHAEKAGFAAAVIPFVAGMSSSSSENVNGVLVAWSYTDWVAIVCGSLAVGLVAFGVRAVLTSPVSAARPIRLAILAVIAAAGTYHLLHGTGTIGGPKVYERSTSVTPPATVEASAEDSESSTTPTESTAALSDRSDACEKGDADSCFALGVAYERGKGVAKDEARAAALYRRGCDAGGGAACFNLGVLFENGRGVAKDEVEAAALYRKGCDAGEALACFNLGVLFENGRGVAKDEVEAAALYRRGCDAGKGSSCLYLGDFYRDGTGVTKDLAAAVSFYDKSCKLRSPNGCNSLGLMYKAGDGVAQDVTRAAALFSSSCDLDLADGCRNLALVSGSGQGTEKRSGESSPAA